MTADLVAAREGLNEEEVSLDDPLTSGQSIAPIACWLVSDKAAGISGQVIHGGRGSVGLIAQNAMFRLYETDHVWSLDELDKLLPSIMDEKKAFDAELAKAAEPKKV